MKDRPGNLLALLDLELYKVLKDHLSKWLSCTLAIILSIVFIQVFALNSALTLGNTIEYPANPYLIVFMNFQRVLKFMFPLITAMICSQYYMLENRFNGIYFYKTLPFSKFQKSFIKYLCIIFIITIAIVLTYLAYSILILAGTMFFPLLGFQNYDFTFPVFIYFIKLSYLGFCIGLLQLGLCRLTTSWKIPLFICLFLILSPWVILPYYSSNGYINDLLADLIRNDTSINLISGLKMLIPAAIVFLLNYIKYEFHGSGSGKESI